METGGKMLKFFVWLFFMLNFTLRACNKMTMVPLWDLLHHLQILYLLTMVPVQISPVLTTFIAYFEVATGELEEVDTCKHNEP